MNTEIQTVQAVARAIRLLKWVALAHEDGQKVRALTAMSGMNRTTVIRLLTCLAQTGYVQRCDETGMYRPGIKVMQLGLVAMTRAPLVERFRPMMKSIARIAEDTVFLVVRNGDYAHCLHLEEGSFPVRVFLALIGSFRLMGEGTGGQALLATLPDVELHELCQRHAADYARKGFSADQLQRMVQHTRRAGYATGISLGVRGANAVGVSFEVMPGHYAALSVAAIASRMDEKRRAEIALIVKNILLKEGFTPLCYGRCGSSVQDEAGPASR